MEKKIINIPSTLSQMPLRDYIKINEIISNAGDNEMLARKQIVQYYTGCAFKDVDKVVTATEFNAIVDNIANCLNERPEIQPVVKIGEITFGFIPILEKMSTGEYIDLESYLGDVKTWDKAMAVLYRPIVEVEKKGWLVKRFGYDIEPYEGSSKYSEKMLDMPASVAYGATLFFWTLSMDLLKASLISIEKMLGRVMISQQQKDSLESTKAGIRASMQQLEETSLIWKGFKSSL